MIRMDLLLAAVILLQDKSAEQLLEKLQSSKIEERETASKELKALGRKALPEVERAAQSTDLDLAARAKAILVAIRSQIAEDTFQKIEENIAKARSVSIKIDYDWVRKDGDDTKRFRGSGTLLLKEGNKLSMFLHGADQSGEPIKNIAVCDGSSLFFRGQLWNWSGEGTLGDVKQAQDIYARVFARGGAAVTADCWRQLPYGVEKMAALSEFADGGSDKDAGTLVYKIASTLGLPMKVKVWYDPKSFALLKRIIEVEQSDKKGVCIETYSGFTLNSEIPDDSFKLPEKK